MSIGGGLNCKNFEARVRGYIMFSLESGSGNPNNYPNSESFIMSKLAYSCEINCLCLSVQTHTHTHTHSIQMFGEIPFVKPENDT